MPALPAYPAPSTRVRVRTYTFGCKVNRADTARVEHALLRGGAELIDGEASPDVVLVNTCTVTRAADRQARQLLRRIRRENPAARIVVTGCYAESDPERLRTFEGVSDVVPIGGQEGIAELLGLAEGNGEAGPAVVPGRTRAIVKLQEGCNAYCAFCILPYIRGRSRSVPAESLRAEAGALAGAGYRELVLTGTHIGAYGRDLTPRLRFSDALRILAGAAPGVALRVSSLEPQTLSPDVVRAVGEIPSIRPHFHIPLQSGSDAVLRRMNRKYRAAHFADRVSRLSATRPQIGLGTDVIVGFPGETDADFGETVRLLRDAPVTFLHVFRYSPRPGTKAAAAGDDVPDLVKRERMELLLDLDRELRRRFHGRFVGTVEPVLVEKKRDREGRLTGYTPHYVPVRFRGPDRLMEREVEVRIDRADERFAEGDTV